MKFRVITFLILLSTITHAQIVTIEGFAPQYKVGEKVRLFRFQDLITHTTEQIASTTIKSDSTFTLNFNFNHIEKLKIQVANNYGFLYVQPEGRYQIFFPLKNKDEPIRELGSEIILSFKNLDTSDINYKILEYNSWENYFIGHFYLLRRKNSVAFSQHLDTFKVNVEKYYSKDTSEFLKTFVRFRIAALDELSFVGSRNSAEKFDQYLKYSTVYYNNPPYMKYIKKFFASYIGTAPSELNNKIYLAILKSSPSYLLNAMGRDYRMKNLRLRELIMIKSLGDIYYSGEYPQTNIETILDSLSQHTLFKANQIIAKNMLQKLTNLKKGSKLPYFTLYDFEDSLWSFSEHPKKYKYFQFIDYGDAMGIKEMELLKPLYERYHGNIEIITVFLDKNKKLSDSVKQVTQKEFPWTLTTPANDFDIMQRLNISTLPFYILTDPKGVVIQNPALKPSPNGEYQTIESTFFDILKKMYRK